MLTVINHNDKIWRSKVKRTNGALVYSTYLCKYDIPIWRTLMGNANIVISTCPIFSEVRGDEYIVGNPDIAIQYLHTFPKTNPVQYVRDIMAGMPWKPGKVVFITAYKSYASLLLANGINACWMPVRIDTEDLNTVISNDTGSRYHDRMLWFGNVYNSKKGNFAQMQSMLEDAGFVVDVISEDKLNGKPVSRKEVLELLPKYMYGCGVGQCAMEMMYLGIRVIIAGDGFGGIIANAHDWHAQRAMNINSRVCTYDSSILNCISHIKHSEEWYRYNFEDDKMMGEDIIQQIIAEIL